MDKFEPTFNAVINRFQTTFDNCTKAFGDNFEKNVVAVADAVDVMGRNMDKINDNIDLQKRVLEVLKSNEIVVGMDKYIEAANHFVGITQSLNKFEEARRLMLAAAQEAIALQNQYSESLKIPREVAVRVNQILDRIKTFEDSVNNLAGKLAKREILGNDVVNLIQDQINGIAKKGKIADKFLQISEGKLEDLYNEQSKAISEMNRRYKEAIEGHIAGFETMLEGYTKELGAKHSDFLKMLQESFNIEDVRREFSNLKRLDEILSTLRSLSERSVKSDSLSGNFAKIQNELERLGKIVSEKSVSEKKGWSIFGK